MHPNAIGLVCLYEEIRTQAGTEERPREDAGIRLPSTSQVGSLRRNQAF